MNPQSSRFKRCRFSKSTPRPKVTAASFTTAQQRQLFPLPGLCFETKYDRILSYEKCFKFLFPCSLSFLSLLPIISFAGPILDHSMPGNCKKIQLPLISSMDSNKCDRKCRGRGYNNPIQIT